MRVRLLTPKDVAQMLGVSPVTVLRLADAGALPAVEVARGQRKRLLRWRPEAVEKFITAREKKTQHA